MKNDGMERTVLYDLLKNHAGTQIMDALRGFRATSVVLESNQRELVNLIYLLEDSSDPLNITNIENRALLDAYFTEVYRLLHNFLAAATTLIDHTRRIIESEIICLEHRKEYSEDKDATFIYDPLSKFVKDFRNYMLHRERPPISLSIEWTPETVRHVLQIDLESMAAWNKWTSPSQKFIASNSPSIRIDDIVSPYAENVICYGNRFVDRFNKYFASEISEVMSLAAQWNKGLE